VPFNLVPRDSLLLVPEERFLGTRWSVAIGVCFQLCKGATNGLKQVVVCDAHKIREKYNVTSSIHCPSTAMYCIISQLKTDVFSQV